MFGFTGLTGKSGMISEVIKMSKKVSTIVSEYILKEIHKGNFTKGDKLPSERVLAKKLNVGRSSIREALNSLVDMNVVEKRMGIGVFVKETDLKYSVHSYFDSGVLDAQEFKELLEFRLMFEVEVCKRASNYANEEDILIMENAIEMFQDAIQTNSPTIESDALFHKAIVGAARNSVATKVYDFVSGLLVSMKQELLLVEDKHKSLYYHQQIFAAIKNQDEAKASSMMREHLNDVSARYSKLFEL